MLKLRQVGSNMTEVEVGRALILFSYQTPVACHIDGQGFFKTDRKWSVTTSKHITKWLNGQSVSAQERPQEFFDDLISL